jgi:hypothetical protein
MLYLRPTHRQQAHLNFIFDFCFFLTPEHDILHNVITIFYLYLWFSTNFTTGTGCHLSLNNHFGWRGLLMESL